MQSIAKIKWSCRRGTKELDCILEAFLQNHYAHVSQEEQFLFCELLSLQDSQLILFFLGDQLPGSKGLAELVKKIRKHTNI